MLSLKASHPLTSSVHFHISLDPWRSHPPVDDVFLQVCCSSLISVILRLHLALNFFLYITPCVLKDGLSYFS